ncbi:MAG: ABC transporter substrate-binding protein [Lachnospiraceae bacterium]|nr:ABC transporter substrate-binding protein [Lachnospiraceae bacterium]
MKKHKKIIYITAVVVGLLLAAVYTLNAFKAKKPADETPENSIQDDRSLSEDVAEMDVEDGLVRLAMDVDVGNMDVAKNSDNYFIALNVFDTLVETKQTENGSSIVPSFASEWQVSEDGKTFSFTLRNDAHFSDGTPVTAEDVEFSLTRLLTVPDSEQTAFGDMIEGADEVQNGEATALRGIEVIDDHHINITLKEAFPSFLSMLGSPACSILSKKSVNAAGDSYGTDIRYIIGSGPYVITSSSDNLYVFELNPYYYGEEPSVKKAEVSVMVPAVMDREFRNKRLDILDLDYINPETVSFYIDNEEYKNSLVAKENVEIISLMLNTATAPLDDVRVRRAIQYAIDRRRIINEVYGGYAEFSDGIIPKGLVGYNEDLQGWLEYDPQKARELIEEAGVGRKDIIEMAISSTADTALQQFTSLVQEDLNAVGLNAVTVVYDRDSRLYLRRNGLIMAYQFQWLADYNDPDNFIYTAFGSKDATKRYSSNYADEDTINRIVKARNISDFDERMAEYNAIEKKLVVDDAVWVPFLSTRHIFVKGERVDSFEPYWAGWGDMPLKGITLK